MSAHLPADATHCQVHGWPLKWMPGGRYPNGAQKRSRRCTQCDAESRRRRRPRSREAERLKPRFKLHRPKPDPERKRLHGTLRRAVKRGEITPQPCEVCGLDPNERDSANRRLVYGHIPDGTAPLDAIWVCARCLGRKRQRVCPETEREEAA